MDLQQAFINLSAKLPDSDDVVRRLDRAYDIINGYGYEITDANNVWLISKASTSLVEDTSVTYNVTDRSCSCPDFDKARAGLCKHRLAVKLLEMMKGTDDV